MGTVLYIPPREQTVGDVLPLLDSAPWQRALLAKRLRDEFARGFWLGLAIAGPLWGWGAWLMFCFAKGTP
jgi:hypothetical protein